MKLEAKGPRAQLPISLAAKELEMLKMQPLAARVQTPSIGHHTPGVVLPVLPVHHVIMT